MWSVWSNLKYDSYYKHAIYYQWTTFVLWLLFICAFTIWTTSNFILTDIDNGIFSLEIRKGLDHKTIVWVKILISKTISWSAICLGMLLFFVIVKISAPLNNDYFLKGYIPGYTALIAADIFFTGICVLVGSFLKMKVMLSVSAFLATLLSLSPAFAILHVEFLLNSEISVEYKNINSLKIQSLAKENPKGIVNFMFSELAKLKEETIFDLKEKPNSSTDLKGDEAFKKIEEYFKEAHYEVWGVIYYYINFGYVLDLEFLFNENEKISKNTEFKLSDSFKSSDLYKFYELSNLKNAKGNFKDTLFNGYSKKNLSGKNQLNDYIKFLTSKDTITSLETTLGLENIKDEIIEIKEIIKHEIAFFEVSLKDGTEEGGRKNIINFNDNFSQSIGYEHISYWWLHSWIVNLLDYQEELSIRDGNQMFMMFLTYFIGKAAKLNPDRENVDYSNSVYQIIQNDPFSLRKVYLVNPFMSLVFMSLYTVRSNDVGLNNVLMKNLNSWLILQDIKLIQNPKWINQQRELIEPYSPLEDVPTIDYEESNVVLRSGVYYISYLFFGLTFLLIGHFIYIRKVKP